MSDFLPVFICIFDCLSVIYLLDWTTCHYSGKVMYTFSWTVIYANRWSVFRALLTIYIIQRVGFLLWRRRSVFQRLKRKRNDLLDKHSRLNEKLKATETVTNIQAENITALSLNQLRNCLMQDKKLSSLDTIEVFQRNALNIWFRHPGCIAEIVFDADVYAILADGKISNDPELHSLSSLHGIPVAVSEVFPVRGCDHTMGYVSRVCRSAEEDCVFIKQLRETGAIPFVSTTYRQKLLSLSAKSPIYGNPRHPTHPTRSCVNGDAAIVALKGTPLAFAADTLGEARLAAAFCGLCSFKPSAGRMTEKGLNLPVHLPNILGVIPAPITRSVVELVETMKSLWQPMLFDLDCNICPAKFDTTAEAKVLNSKLRIGYFDGFSNLLSVSKPVEKMMNTCRKAIESRGHVLINFEPPEVEHAFELVFSLVFNVIRPEILQLVYKHGHGDVMVDKKQRILHFLYALPPSCRKTLCSWRAEATKMAYPSSSLVLHGIGSTKSYTELVEEAEDYRQTFFNAWKEAGLDCLICPVAPIPAPCEPAPFYVVNCCYLFTAIFNLLGSPCGTIPMGTVTQADIGSYEETSVTSDKTTLMFAEQLKGSEGLPLGLQVVGRPWQDETVLGVMKMITEMNIS